MTLPRAIGITGGIGCGKSTVSRVFAVLGIPVYDADSRAKWVMQHDPALKARLLAAFGPEAYLPDGTLNRTHLARRVFHDPAQVEGLNRLVHPCVAHDYAQWRERHPRAPYTLREAALLYEAGATHGLHAVLVVTAPVELRLRRVLLRDPHRTLADVQAIMAKQLPEEEKISRADHLVHNDETRLVVPQVLALDALFRRA